MTRLKKEHVNNFLQFLQKTNEELKEIILVDADARCGKRIALAKKLEFGAIDVLTDYLKYEEMNQFLRGYMFKSNNRIK